MKPFLIAPQSEGLVNNLEPWLLPENAYAELNNAYVWRGRIRKRFGLNYLNEGELDSRLRVNIGTTAAITGNLGATIVPGIIWQSGQMFSVGDEKFTVVSDVAGSQAMLSTGAGSGTFDVSTGSVVLTGATPSTAVYYYPSTPVMGILLRQSSTLSQQNTLGFDQQFSYQRTGGAWERLGSKVWAESDSNFYSSVNYRGTNPYDSAFYVVNHVSADLIQYLPTSVSTAWSSLNPQLDSGATRTLQTAKIIIGFKDRLVVLNTIEKESGSDRTYQNRARWSQNGDPTAAATAWLDDTPGRGGYNDATTEEQIIAADFIKDRLIVYFEKSTWELVYTGDTSLPFRWQQLNNELGAESTFSTIGFDKGVVAVGNVGIHTSNGVNVERIDEKIPDEVFKIHNGNSGPERVYGIRDYYRELVYWTFPDATGDPTYPTKVLVWNYQNNTWSFFEDSLTCFGYLQRDSDLTWSKLGAIFSTWAGWNQPWTGAPSQSQFPDIIAGNQQGYTLKVNADSALNKGMLYVTNMDTALQQMTVKNHNLKTGDIVLINGQTGITLFQDTLAADIITFPIVVVDADTISINTTPISESNPYVFGWTGTYTGGATLARISNIGIRSKQWNPGTPIGRQFRLHHIDFLLDRTQNGEITVDYYPDFNSDESIQNQVISEVLLGSNVLYTKPETGFTGQSSAQRIWHRYFLQLEGQTIQIKLTMSNAQMRNPLISQSDFQMDGLIIYVSQEGRITG